MTDVVKAVVKLPPKSRQSIALKSNYDGYSPPHRQSKEPLHYDSYLVSDRLYIQVPSAIVEYDILDLLQSCQPQDIHLTGQPFPELSSGYITFPTKDQADLAFTLFNGANFSNGMRLSLYMNPLTSECDPEPAADILQVQNLPADSTNKSLYDLFRSFGPMALCKVVVEQGDMDYRGAALIRYYHPGDADHAVSFMNNRRIQENIITVFPFVSGKRQRSNAEMDMQRGSHSNNHAKQGSDANAVDYTNLYIKNLDLNAKSADLFKHFRKFGHIISARVMNNARTNQSKGFGFVSFVNAEEADRARHAMNGRFILSKAVQVAFHEPKKTRNEKSGGAIQQDNTNGDGRPSNTTDTYKSNNSTHLSHMAPPYSPPTPHNNYSHHSPIPQQHHPRTYQEQQPTSQYHHQASVSYQQQQQSNQHTTNDESATYMSPLGRKTHQTLINRHEQPVAFGNSAISDHTTAINGCRSPRTNDRNGNVYPMTSNSKKHTGDYDHSYSNYSPSRKQLLGTGILNGTNNHHSTTPSSLSTLASGAVIQSAPLHHPPSRGGPRPSMRRRGSIESICTVMTETSTNAQRQRLALAVLQCSTESKDLIAADQVDDIVDMLLTLKKKERSLCLFNPDFLKSKVQQAKTALETFDDGDDDDDGSSNHEPAPPTTADNSKPINDMQCIGKRPSTTAAPSPEEIDAFLASLDGMAMHEKKQKLGDWLFPLVKATGIKHAPKITIRLLDTIPLHELARLMHVESSLRLKIDQVMADNSQPTVV